MLIIFFACFCQWSLDHWQIQIGLWNWSFDDQVAHFPAKLPETKKAWLVLNSNFTKKVQTCGIQFFYFLSLSSGVSTSAEICSYDTVPVSHKQVHCLTNCVFLSMEKYLHTPVYHRCLIVSKLWNLCLILTFLNTGNIVDKQQAPHNS